MSDYLDQVAKETNTEALLKIIEESRPGALRVLASSQIAGPEVFTRLLSHPSKVVRNELARNKKTPTDVLKVMLLDTEVCVRDSARYTLGRLGRPKVEEVKLPQAPEVKPVEDVVKEIKKEKSKNNNRKGRRKKGKK